MRILALFVLGILVVTCFVLLGVRRSAGDDDVTDPSDVETMWRNKKDVDPD